MNSIQQEINDGLIAAYTDSTHPSNLAYRPQFVSNDYKNGRKVISAIESELLSCEKFQISVAFINMGGITPLLPIFKELEKRGIPGEILNTNYLNFSEPKAIEKLNSFSNITVKMYDVGRAGEGFHTKGYIFRKDEIFHIIIGSSNLTSAALTKNREWNTKIISSVSGEMTQEIIKEFDTLWNSEFALSYDQFYEKYKSQYRLISYKRRLNEIYDSADSDRSVIQPNKMQRDFIRNLRKIIDSNEDRALLISSTGTGKTFASAFAIRELGFKRILFLVHRKQLAFQTIKSFKRVFGNSVKMGLVGSGKSDYDADFIFSTIQTLYKDEHLKNYSRDHFDCIVIDEAHHVTSAIYQKILKYFTPSLWLGMTATPDKRDDGTNDVNIYEIFNYQIAYEIRLQQAMEEDFLCPFHYFGITDLSRIDGSGKNERKLNEEYFNRLTCDERVRHIIEQAKFYGYSGNRVKGLVFCSRIDESVELSAKFNAAGYRTVALNGDSSAEQRTEAFERLAMDESDSSESMQPLDYIFSVDILNEGVDIVEVNQVIMLRPTQSPIVFIQQLGRGLRKAQGKEYVVILDFIGNYTNNFMIPIALSGDCSYNPDNIKKYVISGNSVIPGASTVHFDEVAKERIFRSIDSIKGLKAIIKERYSALKNRIGRVPYLCDFYQNNEIDPLVIIREFRTYQAFLESMEHELYSGKLSEQEKLTLEYLSKTILSGIRPYELEILKRFSDTGAFSIAQFKKDFTEKYGYEPDENSLENAVKILKGHFVSKDEEYEKFKIIDIIDELDHESFRCTDSYSKRLKNDEFSRQINDIVEVGLSRYREKYYNGKAPDSRFVLYEKYSRRDVSLLMNCGKDLSSTMYGMKRIDDDVFIFVTYHKEENNDETKSYVDGKPDYADIFEDNMSFRWDSQIGRGIDSSYVADVTGAANKHLLVKKSDSETGFYYMGQFDIIEKSAAKKKDNSGRERDITKFKVRMKNAVRDDLLEYLQSNIIEKDEMTG